MTPSEFDDLVRRIGDEILARMGSAVAIGATSSLAAASACGCSPAPVPDPSSAAAGNGNAGHWSPPKEGIAGLIDHTLLRPDATERDIATLCQEASQHGFAAVCVHPAWVARAVRELRWSQVKTAAVIGFPHGATVTPAKCTETEQVLKLGAVEIDVVVQIGALKAGDLDAVYSDLRPVVDLAHSAGAVVKAILEMGCLGEEEKIHGCVLAKLAGADFVKTSTGFGPSGANARDVALARRVVGAETGIKAAGGIRSFEDFRAMMAAGATRIGASASIEILRQAAAQPAAAFRG
jgi:deoxyribose-phosphate aldolase